MVIMTPLDVSHLLNVNKCIIILLIINIMSVLILYAFCRFVQEGDSVSEFDEICEVQSDKVSLHSVCLSVYTHTCLHPRFPCHENVRSIPYVLPMTIQASVTITSRYSGIVKKLHYAVDDIARVVKPLVDIEVKGGAEGEDGPPTTPPLEEGQPVATPITETSTSASSKVLATPAVRRIAAENKVSGLVR